MHESIDKSLAKGAWDRLIRKISADQTDLYERRSKMLLVSTDKLSQGKPNSSKLISAILLSMQQIFQSSNSLLAANKMKYSKTAGAESVYSFYLCKGQQVLCLPEVDVKEHIYNEDVLGISRHKLYIDKNRIEIFDSIWYEHFSRHCFIRWCMRDKTIDTDQLQNTIRNNLFFMEFIRFSGLQDNLPIAIPFGNGLALGFIRHGIIPTSLMQTYSLKHGYDVKNVPHNIWASAHTDKDYATYLDFRTYVSHNEMRTSQRVFYHHLSNWRNDITQKVQKIYTLLHHIPSDELVTAQNIVYYKIEQYLMELSDLRERFVEFVISDMWIKGAGDPIDDKAEKLYSSYLRKKELNKSI